MMLKKGKNEIKVFSNLRKYEMQNFYECSFSVISHYLCHLLYKGEQKFLNNRSSNDVVKFLEDLKFYANVKC